MITTKPITSVAYVIALRGEPDVHEVDLLADRLADLLAHGTREIAVDLSGIIGAAPTALLDLLQQAAELLEQAGGGLLLASGEVHGNEYRLVRVDPTRPESVRGLHPSLDAALASSDA